jgi:hypothetical protein
MISSAIQSYHLFYRYTSDMNLSKLADFCILSASLFQNLAKISIFYKNSRVKCIIIEYFINTEKG